MINKKPTEEDWKKVASTFKEFIDIKIKNQVNKNGFHKEDILKNLNTATENARVNFTTDENGNPTLYSTSVFRLAEKIKEFIPKEIFR